MTQTVDFADLTLDELRVALAPAPLPTGGELQEFIRYKTTRRAHNESQDHTDPAVLDNKLFN